MVNINFYCLNEDMMVFFYVFLTKFYENNKKILIYSTNNEKNKELDSFLWTCKKISFIPHLLSNDKNSEKTNIVITNQLENINKSEYLITTDYIDNDNFLNEFDKIYYIFDEINVRIARENWKKYKDKNYILEYFEKKNGKWEKRV